MVTVPKSQWESWKITCFVEKSQGKSQWATAKMTCFMKSPPTGEESMGNCENDMFYEKVHPQGKSQWETGKMEYFPQKSTHRGKVNGNLEK
jgi:hypothetical protein